MYINPYKFYKSVELHIDDRFKTLGKALLAIATLVSTTVLLYKYFKTQDNSPPTPKSDEPVQAASDPDAILSRIKEDPEAAKSMSAALKQNKDFALQVLQLAPEAFFHFDEAIRQDEEVILGYINSPNLDLKTSKGELYIKYFFLSSKLKPFFDNFKVMNACLLLIDKMDEGQRKFFYEGLLLDLERNQSCLLENATFMQALRNRNPELTPEYSHLPSMSPVSPKKPNRSIKKLWNVSRSKSHK